MQVKQIGFQINKKKQFRKLFQIRLHSNKQVDESFHLEIKHSESSIPAYLLAIFTTGKVPLKLLYLKSFLRKVNIFIGH